MSGSWIGVVKTLDDRVFACIPGFIRPFLGGASALPEIFEGDIQRGVHGFEQGIVSDGLLDPLVTQSALGFISRRL